MLFNTPIFLFAFLPAVLLAYALAGRRFRNALLVAASWLFYAWGDPYQLPLLLALIAANYGLGRWIGRRVQRGVPARWALWAGLAFNLGLLALFKYSLFVLVNLQAVLNLAGLGLPPLAIAWAERLSANIPPGISFLVFSALSYLLDISKKLYPPQANPLRFALYLSLFPKLIAGPLARYREIDKQHAERPFGWANLSAGMRRFIIGLAKKVLIAGPLAGLVDSIFSLPAGQLPAGVAWLGAISYALQIYYDFSGYTDMAIGLGLMFGFRLPENFNFPYVAQSMADFWRRWHITLSNWFRDYVYFPLERKRNRASTWGIYANILIVFFLTGLWHGAAWTFIVWGLIQGGFIALERSPFGAWLARSPRPLRHFYAVLVILVSWVFFRSPGLGYSLRYLGAMLGANGARGLVYTGMFTNAEVWLALLVGAAFSVPLGPALQRLVAGRGEAAGLRQAANDLVNASLVLALLVLSLAYLAGSTTASFIYFRF
jgi:alginate O-acetyltransferase complex protein AlgI